MEPILGGRTPQLTATLLWHANVDLDFYFTCDAGDEIGYGITATCGAEGTASSCGGCVDKDSTAGDVSFVRGDGSEG